MKKKLLFTFIFSAIISSLTCFGQNEGSTDWEHIYLQVAGHNEVDGVYAWFKESSCDEDVVFLKFKNTNDKAVNVSWYGGVFKSDLTWVDHSDLTYNFEISANSEVEASCVNENSLLVKLNDYSVKSSEFKRFTTKDFTVTPIR